MFLEAKRRGRSCPKDSALGLVQWFYESLERMLFLGLRQEATATQSMEEAVGGYTMHRVRTEQSIGCSKSVCVCVNVYV